MQFALGFITGIILGILIFAILAYFRAGIEQRVKVIEKIMNATGPKPKGYIDMPEDEAEITRQAIIAKNRKAGKDTPISELQ